MTGWTMMDELEPWEEGEILFVAKDGITDERIGIVVPAQRIVVLKRTDISFDDIEKWLPIPE